MPARHLLGIALVAASAAFMTHGIDVGYGPFCALGGLLMFFGIMVHSVL